MDSTTRHAAIRPLYDLYTTHHHAEQQGLWTLAHLALHAMVQDLGPWVCQKEIEVIRVDPGFVPHDATRVVIEDL